MRVVLAALAALSLPLTVFAASWHHFDSRSLGFSLRYPPGWHVSESSQPLSRQVVVTHGSEALTVTLLASQVRSLAAAASRFRAADPTLAGAHWTRSSLAGRPALWTALHPQTEGGVHESVGVLIVQSRRTGYEITAVDYASAHASSLRQFPAVYRQILGTWRFS